MYKKLCVFLVVLVLLVAQLPVFLLDFVPQVYATTANFGYTGIGGAGTTTTENNIVGSVFTTTEAGEALNITAYLTPSSTYIGNHKAAIYKHDVGHTDLAYINTTAAVTVSAEAGWYWFNFAAGTYLTADTQYILEVWGTNRATSGQTCVISFASGDTNQSHVQSATYGTWPDPLVPTHGNNKYSIYCTYTPSGDTVKPNPSNVGRTTSYTVGSSCDFYTKWTDDVGLATTGGWKFESNVSGTATNSSWTAFTANPDWSNKSETLVTGTIAWCFYANDTSNNWNSTAMQYLTIVWGYRLSHVICNATGAGTNYQMYFNIYRGVGTGSGNNVYLNNHNASVFPNDLAFTDDDGVTLLDYWVASYSSTWAGVWVEVADDLSSVNRTIYVYFGKAGATSASNFDNTFISGDPFDNVSLNTTRWTSVDGNPTYTINATDHYLEVTDMDVNWDNGKGFHGKTFTFPVSYMIQDAYSSSGFIMYHDSTDVADYFGAIFAVEHHVWTSYDSGIAFATAADLSAATTTINTFMGVGDNYDYNGGGTPPQSIAIKIWKVGGNIIITVGEVTRVDEANSQTPDRIELGIQRYTGQSFGTERFYAFIVRKYVSPEPSHGEWEIGALITVLTDLVNNKINWAESIETVYLGTMFGKTSMTDLQNVIAASTSWQDVLMWSAITIKFGIENETKIKWALSAATMVAGLPDSGGGYYQVQSRGLLYGYYWADKYSYLQSKWNTTTAFNNFADAYDYTGHGFLWYISPTDTYVYFNGPRYLDECAQTLGCFLVFYEVCNVSEALTYAETEWEFLNNNLWYAGGGYGDPHFAYTVTDAYWECSGGAFLQIIGWLKYCSPNVENISRLITDMSNRFLADKWYSPQWTYWPTTYPAIVIHHNGMNPQRRLTSTVTAWSSLFSMYYLFNNTEVENFQDELNGYDAYPPAWECLYNETAGLYDPSTGMFRTFSDASATNLATALATALQFMMGITPVNAVLAVPVESLFYEHLYNMFDSQIFNISLTTRKVTVGIYNVGTVNFTFNAPVTQMFNEAGLFELTFDSSWNTISSCSKIGSLPDRRYLHLIVANLNASLAQPISISWTVLRSWTASIHLTQSILASWSILRSWIGSLPLTQMIGVSWSVLCGRVASISLTQMMSSSWNTIMGLVRNANLAYSVTTAWSTVGHWLTNIGMSQSIVSSWNVLNNWAASVPLSQTVSSSWNTIVHFIFNVNFAQPISSSWNILSRWTANIGLSQNVYVTNAPVQTYESQEVQDGTVYAVYGTNWYAQTFTANQTYSVESIYLYLGIYDGTPSGTIIVGISATLEGLPVGQELFNGTLAASSVTSAGWYQITMSYSNGQLLCPDQQYAIVVRDPNDNVSNCIAWFANSLSQFQGGACYSSDGGTSWNPAS